MFYAFVNNKVVKTVNAKDFNKTISIYKIQNHQKGLKKMEKQKNEYNKNIEIQILNKIHQFFETKTKAELVLMTKKDIAKAIEISVVSLDKYLLVIVELNNQT